MLVSVYFTQAQFSVLRTTIVSQLKGDLYDLASRGGKKRYVYRSNASS